MPVGTVKWFNTNKNWGFIGLSNGSKDVFVHSAALQKSGLTTLRRGQRVQYELVSEKNGKTSVENLKAVDH